VVLPLFVSGREWQRVANFLLHWKSCKLAENGKSGKTMKDRVIWRDIPGMEGKFRASNKGDILMLPYQTKSYTYNGGLVLPSFDRNAYLQVRLRIDTNIHITKKVHRLIASAFLDDYSHDAEVNHINGDKQDNRVQNLEMVTHLENMRHAKNTLNIAFQSAGKQNSNYRGAVIGTHKKNGQKIRLEGKEEMKKFGFSPNCIYDCLAGRQASHKCYTWVRENLISD
jgi:hypothetical protein